MNSSQPNHPEIDLNFDESGSNAALVHAGSNLPHCFQVQTSKLLDVIVALRPRGRNLSANAKKQFRKQVNQRLYNKTRPGFTLAVGDILCIAYAGQPNGHGTQHQWRIFCGDQLKGTIETLIAGTALTSSPPPDPEFEQNGTGPNHCREWGGLYLRSEAEVRIAKALDQTGLLFFANARGRVGLQNTVVSNSQLTGRVEADFMVFHQRRCLILEVDGQHHLEEGQTIRDYARDRVLLRSGGNNRSLYCSRLFATPNRSGFRIAFDPAANYRSWHDSRDA